jgi:hypothetical protein
MFALVFFFLGGRVYAADAPPARRNLSPCPGLLSITDRTPALWVRTMQFMEGLADFLLRAGKPVFLSNLRELCEMMLNNPDFFTCGCKETTEKQFERFDIITRYALPATLTMLDVDPAAVVPIGCGAEACCAALTALGCELLGRSPLSDPRRLSAVCLRQHISHEPGAHVVDLVGEALVKVGALQECHGVVYKCESFEAICASFLVGERLTLRNKADLNLRDDARAAGAEAEAAELGGAVAKRLAFHVAYAGTLKAQQDEVDATLDKILPGMRKKVPELVPFLVSDVQLYPGMYKDCTTREQTLAVVRVSLALHSAQSRSGSLPGGATCFDGELHGACAADVALLAMERGGHAPGGDACFDGELHGARAADGVLQSLSGRGNAPQAAFVPDDQSLYAPLRFHGTDRVQFVNHPKTGRRFEVVDPEWCPQLHKRRVKFGECWEVLQPRKGDPHMCFRQHQPDGTYKWYTNAQRAKDAGAWD